VENPVGNLSCQTEKIRQHSSLPRFEQTFVQFLQLVCLQGVEKFFLNGTGRFDRNTSWR
jgi:hypothetical protein